MRLKCRRSRFSRRIMIHIVPHCAVYTGSTTRGVSFTILYATILGAVALLADISVINEDARLTDGHIRLGVAGGKRPGMGLVRTRNRVVKQDGTGSRTAAWGTNWKWPAGTAPTLTTTA